MSKASPSEQIDQHLAAHPELEAAVQAMIRGEDAVVEPRAYLKLIRLEVAELQGVLEDRMAEVAEWEERVFASLERERYALNLVKDRMVENFAQIAENATERATARLRESLERERIPDGALRSAEGDDTVSAVEMNGERSGEQAVDRSAAAGGAASADRRRSAAAVCGGGAAIAWEGEPFTRWTGQ